MAMTLVEAFLEILDIPTIATVIAFLLGVMVGWSWKPRWASLGNCKFQLSAPSSPSALVSPPLPLKNKGFGSAQSVDSLKVGTPSFGSCIMDSGSDKDQIFTQPSMENPNCR